MQESICEIYICRGRKSNLVEFEILPEESPIGLSTKFSLVETPIGLSTSRISTVTYMLICPKSLTPSIEVKYIFIEGKLWVSLRVGQMMKIKHYKSSY